MSLLRSARRAGDGKIHLAKGSVKASKKALMERSQALVKRIRRCKHLEQVKTIHEDLERDDSMDFSENTYVCNSLIEIYGKCGSVDDALRVFDNVSNKNAFTFRFMMTACIDNDRMLDAGRVMKLMPSSDVDGISCTKMITAYGSSGNVKEAKLLFEKLKDELHDNIFFWNAMLSCYTQNGQMNKGQAFFQKMPLADVLSYERMLSGYMESGKVREAEIIFNKMPAWSAVSKNRMVTAYAQAGHLDDANRIFSEMEERGESTSISMLKACVNARRIHEAKKVFDEMKYRYTVPWNILLHGYADCGLGVRAKSTFDEMPRRDVVSWTTMIHYYAGNGESEIAKEAFCKMPAWDVIAGNAMISAYAGNGQSEEAKVLYDSMPEKTQATGASMLQAYALSGKTSEAKEIFHELPKVDVIAWTILLQGFAGFSNVADAKRLFSQMPAHDLMAFTAMMLAYAKHHGHLAEAKELFDNLPQRDIFLWTGLLAAFAQNGHSLSAIETLGRMQQDGFLANEVSFSCVLVACSHVGNVKLGRSYFHSMIGDYGIDPSQEHYSGMVGLLARAGHLDDVEDLIENMPFLPSDSAWRSLLVVCKNQKDLKRAERAAKRALDADPSNSAGYVLLSSIYKEKEQVKS